jgi:AcrR family transcriptional regulator
MIPSDKVSKAVTLTRRGAITRAKLLEAGRKAFSAYGYEAARVADVARIAGVSHGNFYRHFSDKDDLLHAVLEVLHQELRSPVRVERRSAAGGMLDEMINYNTSFFHTYAEHRDMLRVAREAAAKPSPSKFLETWLEMRVPFISRNQRWMKRLKDQGVIDAAVDVDLMAESLGSLIEQLAYVHIGLPKDRPSPDRLSELGQTCGLIWFRSIFGSATAEPDMVGAAKEL